MVNGDLVPFVVFQLIQSFAVWVSEERVKQAIYSYIVV